MNGSGIVCMGLAALALAGCSTVSWPGGEPSEGAEELTSRGGGFPGGGTMREGHPLNGLPESAAIARIAGRYWNGDNWFTRKLDLREDGTFRYTQAGEKIQNSGNVGGPVWAAGTMGSGGRGPVRYLSLYRSHSWDLEGRWFFASDSQFMVRLEIEKHSLVGVVESLPEGAFLELEVLAIPDALADGGSVYPSVPIPSLPRRLYPNAVSLAPHDHRLPSDRFQPKGEPRWVAPFQTDLGQNLVPWLSVDGVFTQ